MIVAVIAANEPWRADGQVQPFNVVTPDNETLHAWHVLPMHLYQTHEKFLKTKFVPDVSQDLGDLPSFQILANHPNARVVVNRESQSISYESKSECMIAEVSLLSMHVVHGNAGHLASGWRPHTYRAFLGSSTPKYPVHVIAFDYRGYGLSTGAPTEEGLINDAQAVVEKLTSPPLSLSRSQIVIAGHSLGSAVAAGVAERLTFDRPDPKGTPFAGVVLFAGFSDLRSLLSTYRPLGFIPPLLSGLAAYPRLVHYVLDSVVDNWNTTSRIARLMGSHRQHGDADVPFNLEVLHAYDDRDIHWSNGMRIWNAAIEAAEGAVAEDRVVSEESSDGIVQEKLWARKPTGSFFKRETAISGKKVRWSRIRHGGTFSFPGSQT